jgi:methionyl-tRNA formyltransferase
MTETIRFGFAGDREIAVRVLRFLADQRVEPSVLLLSAGARATHAEELRAHCPHLADDHVLFGAQFRTAEGVALLRSLQLDVIISIHFPYLMPQSVLATPRRGVINLHPALLPFNRGWHTPSWAILDGTPIGATLHLMDEGVDTGPIIAQREVAVSPADTAHSLYQKVLDSEYELFCETWPSIAELRYTETPQAGTFGTMHRREELLSRDVQRLNLDALTPVGQLLTRLRALTTNSKAEAAFFEVDGRRFRVQIEIVQEAEPIVSRGVATRPS